MKRIDLASGRVLQSIPVDGTAVSVAVAGVGVWVATQGDSERSGRLLRVDPRTGRVTARAGLRTYSAVLAGTSSGPWVLSTHDDYPVVWHVDPVTARTTITSRLRARGVAVAADATGLWTLDSVGNVVLRDPRSGQVLRNLGPVGVPVGNVETDNVLGADAAGAWVVGRDGRSVVRLQGGRVARRISIGAGGTPILAVDRGTLWVASGDPLRRAYSLQRIDAASGAVTARLDLRGHPPRALVPVRDGIAVVAGDGVLMLVRAGRSAQ
jgi:hypothetical protein